MLPLASYASAYYLCVCGAVERVCVYMKEEVEVGTTVCVNMAMAQCKTKEKERCGFGIKF